MDHPERLSLEEAAVSSLINLATLDMARAVASLDAEKVAANDFSNAHLRAVWPVVESMLRDSRLPEVFAIEARLPSIPRNVLVKALMSETAGSAAEKLRLVRESGQRRRATSALETVVALLANTATALPAVAAEARKALEALETQTSGLATLDSEVMAMVDRMEAIAAGEREPILATGLDALDAVIGGLQPTLTVIGAQPGVGKSALLAAIVRNLSRRGIPLGFFSLEDEKRWLVERLVSDASGIPLFVLNFKRLNEHQRERVQEVMPRVHADMANVVMDDRSGLTTAEVVASAREMLARHKVRALFVDHLGEIRLERSDRHDLDIADALRDLRALAKTYRVPVVVACHLRKGDGASQFAQPHLSDFAFSAAVGRMARVALGLCRAVDENDKPLEDTLRIHILKQTNGASGMAMDLELNGPAAVVRNTEAPGTRRALDSFYEGQEARDGDRA